jgi:hypothetical protein
LHTKNKEKKEIGMQKLYITTTTLFSYNFLLYSGRYLYKKSIDIIQIYLGEYLIEKYNFKEVVRIEGKLSSDESEALSSSIDESKDHATSLEF